MSAMKLTPKQEAFALAYIETGNASEAYRRAYDVSPDCKPNTVEKRACELIRDGKVAGRIAELQDRAATKAVLSRTWVLSRLMSNADTAAKAGDFTASNKALELLGKTDELAMFVEKVESKTTVSASVTMRPTIDRPPNETREEWLARRERELAMSAASAGSA